MGPTSNITWVHEIMVDVYYASFIRAQDVFSKQKIEARKIDCTYV